MKSMYIQARRRNSFSPVNVAVESDLGAVACITGLATQKGDKHNRVSELFVRV